MLWAEVLEDAGRGTGGAGAGGAEASGPLARVLRVPENVIVGSSGFQQFFRMYAKLMAGLKDSKVKESRTTPRAIHKAVISAGNPSLEELDWAICEIWPEMSDPKFISIFITNPYINLALSILGSDVWEVGARLELDKTL